MGRNAFSKNSTRNRFHKDALACCLRNIGGSCCCEGGAMAVSMLSFSTASELFFCDVTVYNKLLHAYRFWGH
jgi:hypothetical protein